MSGELVPISPEVLAMLRGAFGKDGVPMPFVKEIFHPNSSSGRWRRRTGSTRISMLRCGCL